MNTTQTDEELNKLFNEVSASLQSNDVVKLDELLKDEELSTTATETAPAEETPPAETENADKTPPTAETPTDEEEPTQTTEQTNSEPEDELGKLREQLKKLSADNHRLSSQAGRVPHLQRRLREIDQKLEQLDKVAASPSNRPSTAITSKLDEKLKNIRETDPELADTIAELAKGLATATDEVADETLRRERDSLTAQREIDHREYVEHEKNRLLDMYPNAIEVFRSDSWKEWKSGQSERIIGLAQSDSADDVALAFRLYAEDMQRRFPEVGTQTPPPAATTVQDPKAAQIEEERKRKKETAVVIGSPTAPGKSELPDNAEALFAKYSEDIRKSMTG